MAGLPASWISRLDLPLIAAPMFLVSSIDLVAEGCRNGIIGSIPANNARSPEILDGWLAGLTSRLAVTRADGRLPAPWALNLVTHRTNPRLPADLDLCAKYQPPLVITALGGPRPAIPVVQAYGGKVFADVNSIDLARKAADAGADGLVLIAAGAGGHTGAIAAPAFVAAVREFWEGPLVLSGAMANGAALRAAQVMGADLVYMGTRFIAAQESMAQEPYKEMVVASDVRDIMLSDAITGVPANKLRPSLVRVGLDPDNLVKRGRVEFSSNENDIKAWKDIWSAGQGVGEVKAIQPTAEIVAELLAGYRAAIAAERADPWFQRYAGSL